jgi:polysaccharide export outer membrane protein
MAKRGRSRGISAGWLVLAIGTACLGCFHAPLAPPPAACPYLPHELDKVSLPAYVLEPPDILILDAIRTVPLPPYRIQTLDTLLIRAVEPLATEPLEGVFVVDPDGSVNLGASYGVVQVVGLTKEEAQAVVRKQLVTVLKNPDVTVSVAQSRAQQQIRGEHLIYPDGTVNLGLYGSAHVAGLTIPEAKIAIEEQLSKYLEKPEVAVSVQGFNSKLIYIITDGAGYGEQVVRLPSTGNDTVLDAISQINGLAPQASRCRIWVARPAPDNACDAQILPVDYKAISQCGRTATNYQLLPGDRLYIKADTLVTVNNWLNKVLSPVERLFGVTLLGESTIRSFGTSNGNGNGLVR